MATELKNQGNAALQSGDAEKAIQYYSAAIDLEPNNHIHYSNRSAAYAKAKKYSEALTDAEKCITLNSTWSKGYSRKGAALELMGKLSEAVAVYEKGLNLEPDSTQLKQSLESAKRAMKDGNSDSVPNTPNPFADPNIRARLAANPKTREYLNQPDFCFMLEQMQRDPKNMNSCFRDPRMLDALGVILNIDLNSMSADNDNDRDFSGNASTKHNGESNKTGWQSSRTPQKPEKMEVDECLSEAMKEKEKGNAAYKEKRFEEAIACYDKGIVLEPENMILYTNKAAVYFEICKYRDCIETCEKAIEVGRESRADFKLIAKAFARIGNAYWKLDDLANAKKYFDKSLSEFRAPDVLKKAQELEKTIKQKEQLAYIDPVKSEEEKNLGNQLFQCGKYPDAMVHYNEAIKRDPSNAKLYSNRAACYTKLMEFNMAVRDCDECIRLEPTFLKGYLRKAAALLAMKDNVKAIECYRKVLEMDPDCQEAQDGYKQAIMQNDDPDVIRKRAMNDPEVQQILADPGMQLILSQMQKEPQAVREHLKNPEIKAKITKLIDVGLVSII